MRLRGAEERRAGVSDHQASELYPRSQLAKRIFDSMHATDELFNVVNRILGAEPEDCLAPGFVWQARATYCDDYDQSVEVVRQAGLVPMTSQEASEILALGFARVYETVGEVSCYWTKNGRGSCLPHPLTEEARAELKLKTLAARSEAQIAELKRENDCLRGIAAKVMPCHYCGAKEIAKCPRGFPGCALADDMACAQDSLATALMEARKKIAEMGQLADGIVERLTGPVNETRP